MSLDHFLSNSIPLAEASAYFLGLKKTAPMTVEAALSEFGSMPKEEQFEILKEAGVTRDEFVDLLEKMASDEAEKGKERGKTNAHSAQEKYRHSRGERLGDTLGRMAGAGGGLTAGHHFGKSPAMALGGAALGQHLGGHGGRAAGRELDAAKTAAFKLALQE